MKPTLSFKKNTQEYEQQQTYKRPISPFSHGNDKTFKRFFSGFGTEGKAHHG